MSKKKKLAWPGVSRRSVTPRDLSNTGSPAGFPKTRAKKRGGMWRIKSAMLSLCLCECGPHSPIATARAAAIVSQISADVRRGHAIVSVLSRLAEKKRDGHVCNKFILKKLHDHLSYSRTKSVTFLCTDYFSLRLSQVG